MPGTDAGWLLRGESRPVRVVVSWAPGGAADLVARVVGQKLGEQLVIDKVIKAAGITPD